MATIQPKGELLRKAVKWISDERKSDTEKTTGELIEEAGVKFNLSPANEEYLSGLLK